MFACPCRAAGGAGRGEVRAGATDANGGATRPCAAGYDIESGGARRKTVRASTIGVLCCTSGCPALHRARNRRREFLRVNTSGILEVPRLCYSADGDGERLRAVATGKPWRCACRPRAEEANMLEARWRMRRWRNPVTNSGWRTRRRTQRTRCTEPCMSSFFFAGRIQRRSEARAPRYGAPRPQCEEITRERNISSVRQMKRTQEEHTMIHCEMMLRIVKSS